MEIFRKRPLCMILCMMLGGFALFQKLDGLVTLIVFLVAFLSAVVAFFIRHKTGVFLSVLLFALSLSFLLSHLYFDLWFFADRRLSGEHDIEATVTEIRYAKSYGAVFTVETEPIDDLPASRYRLRVTSSCDTSSLALGDRLSFHAKILPFQGEADDMTLYGDGYSGYVEIDNYTTLFKDDSYPGRRLSAIRTDVGKYIERVGKDAAPLLTALFLGDKSELSATATSDFSRIGISHLLAVSGMHLAVLSAFLHRLLTLCGVGKKFRVSLVSLFSLMYMALTGFSPSVLRAGVMLLISALLFLFAGTADSPTTLSLSVFIICLFTPYAVFDLSLLLSALATLGILAAPKTVGTPKRKNGVLRLIFSCFSSVFLSFFAIGATLAITVFAFGRLSLLSAVSTLIFGFLTEVFMILGVLSLPVGYFLPTEVPLSFLSDLILRLAGRLSDLPSVYIAADFPITEILTVLFTVAFFSFLFFRIRHRRAAVVLLVLLFLSVYASAGVSSRLALAGEQIDYRSDSEKNESISLLSDADVTVLVTAASDPKAITECLQKRHITEIDSLIFISYEKNTPRFLRSLCGKVKVRHVVFPYPDTNDERFLLRSSESVLKEARVPSRYAFEGECLSLGDATVRLLADGNFILSAKGTSLTYVSSDTQKDEIAALRPFLENSETVIFGIGGDGTRKKLSFEPIPSSVRRLLLTSDTVTVGEKAVQAFLSRSGILLNQPKAVSLSEKSP